MASSLIDVLKILFTRDLTKLREEISRYENEGNLWRVAPGTTNSGGNLCLHLIGNLNTYIAAEFGGTGYVRDRAHEFAGKDIPVAELLVMIDRTIVDVNKGLDEIAEEQLFQDYPQLVFAEKTTTEYFLVHLAGHLSYHLGQINYHRRMLEAG